MGECEICFVALSIFTRVLARVVMRSVSRSFVFLYLRFTSLVSKILIILAWRLQTHPKEHPPHLDARLPAPLRRPWLYALKLLVLFYKGGNTLGGGGGRGWVRVVIGSANLVAGDWRDVENVSARVCLPSFRFFVFLRWGGTSACLGFLFGTRTCVAQRRVCVRSRAVVASVSASARGAVGVSRDAVAERRGRDARVCVDASGGGFCVLVSAGMRVCGRGPALGDARDAFVDTSGACAGSSSSSDGAISETASASRRRWGRVWRHRSRCAASALRVGRTGCARRRSLRPSVRVECVRGSYVHGPRYGDPAMQRQISLCPPPLVASSSHFAAITSLLGFLIRTYLRIPGARWRWGRAGAGPRGSSAFWWGSIYLICQDGAPSRFSRHF